MVVPEHPREHVHVLALELIPEERQRDQPAAVDRVDLRGVPQVAALGRIYAEGGVPVQGV